MEPKNRWIVVGVIVAVGGLAFLLWERKRGATSAAAQAQAQPSYIGVTSPTDLSSVASEPGTGTNIGDFPNTGFNGLGAGFQPYPVFSAPPGSTVQQINPGGPMVPAAGPVITKPTTPLVPPRTIDFTPTPRVPVRIHHA